MRCRSNQMATGDGSRPRSLVIGVGGAGCNAMRASRLDRYGVALQNSASHDPQVITITDSDVAIFRTTSPHLLTKEVPLMRRLEEGMKDRDVIFLFVGLGGETGTHAAPVLAHSARRNSDLVIGIVCLPFSVEGSNRRALAQSGLGRLISHVDINVVLRNDGLAEVAPQIQFRKAFGIMDQIMNFLPEELSKVLTTAGMKQLRDHFHGCSEARLGVGFGSGVYADKNAVEDAFTSPWFDVDLRKVRSCMVILSMAAPDDTVVDDIMRDIEKRLPDTAMMHAVGEDKALSDRVQVTVLLGLA